MNKDRRSRIAHIRSELERILSEEQEALDDLPAALQDSNPLGIRRRVDGA